MDMLILVVILVFSAILHEIMHGYVADRLGDPTARLMGRLTLNPIPHIDPFTSILIPALLIFSGSPIIFGAAKPVPVNPLYLKDGKKDMALVALAGPMTNISLAIIASLLFNFLPLNFDFVRDFMFTAIYINLILAIINLIPIPPLDGSKILASLLPDEIAIRYLSIQSYGIFILFFLLLFPMGGFSLGSLINQLITYSLRLLGV